MDGKKKVPGLADPPKVRTFATELMPGVNFPAAAQRRNMGFVDHAEGETDWGLSNDRKSFTRAAVSNRPHSLESLQDDSEEHNLA
jgi:hypothetical protein